MRAYVARRFLYMLILIFLISIVGFAIIMLPPGDYLTSYVAQLKSQGEQVNEDQIAGLERAYGLGKPMHEQYLRWVSKLVFDGDMGRSFAWRQPVSQLIMDRLPATILVSLGSTILVYVIAIPVGILCAVKQYSIFDYIFSFLGFIGLAVPNFMLALIMMLFFYEQFGVSIGGLYSADMQTAPWGWDKFMDLLAHLPIPLIVIGVAGTAGVIRVMRATLLDELDKPYVETARAKGVSEWRLILKYPVRVALNPIASTIGYILPGMFSGAIITSVVLNLPTVGPLLLESLLTEDMFLAAGIVLIVTVLTIIGTFISDLVLMWLDPRIRMTRS
jgi:peptide/nickel transport system permease protein